MLVLALAVAAQDAEFEVERKDFRAWARAAAWWVSLDGDVRIDDGTLTPSRVDVDDDLDVARTAVPSMELGVAWRAIEATYVGVRATYWGGNWTGEESLGREERFDGTTFGAGTPIRSVMELDYFGGDVLLRASAGDMPLSLELQLGFRYFEADLRMRGGGLAESQHVNEGWTRVGARLEAEPFPAFGLLLELGLGLESNDVLAEAAAGFKAGWGPAWIEGGWRGFFIDENDHDGPARNRIELNLSGPFLGLLLRY
jgi:hypothetical protein